MALSGGHRTRSRPGRRSCRFRLRTRGESGGLRRGLAARRGATDTQPGCSRPRARVVAGRPPHRLAERPARSVRPVRDAGERGRGSGCSSGPETTPNRRGRPTERGSRSSTRPGARRWAVTAAGRRAGGPRRRSGYGARLHGRPRATASRSRVNPPASPTSGRSTSRTEATRRHSARLRPDCAPRWSHAVAHRVQRACGTLFDGCRRPIRRRRRRGGEHGRPRGPGLARRAAAGPWPMSSSQTWSSAAAGLVVVQAGRSFRLGFASSTENRGRGPLVIHGIRICGEADDGTPDRGAARRRQAGGGLRRRPELTSSTGITTTTSSRSSATSCIAHETSPWSSATARRGSASSIAGARCRRGFPRRARRASWAIAGRRARRPSRGAGHVRRLRRPLPGLVPRPGARSRALCGSLRPRPPCQPQSGDARAHVLGRRCICSPGSPGRTVRPRLRASPSCVVARRASVALPDRARRAGSSARPPDLSPSTPARPEPAFRRRRAPGSGSRCRRESARCRRRC